MLTFKKTEHLCNKKLISDAYSKGKQFFYYPFKVIWLDSISFMKDNPVQILISVPKKNISLAVTRNKIKRLIREAFRLNKKNYYEYLTNASKSNLLVLHYTEKKIIPYKEIEAKIVLILQRMQLENEKTNS
jgi:ribonuclease P protein component